jgi:hypothetical protein
VLGAELLERAAQSGAVLLRAETLPEAGSGGLVSGLLLTFDLGRVFVRSDPVRSELEMEYLEQGASAPMDLHSAEEQEPWWRVLGGSLARVWPIGSELARGTCLQFRSDAQNPRIITLEPRGASVSVRLENSPD